MKAKPEHIGKIHLVFDVENLSCKTDGYLLSFACVMFHADEGWFREFSVTLAKGASRRRPGDIDPETVKWWISQAMQNPEAAMEAFFAKEDYEPVSVDDARITFMSWVHQALKEYMCSPGQDELGYMGLYQAWEEFRPQVWGHAPRVDIIQLENGLFGGEGKGPWDFRDENDTRTLMKRWDRLYPEEGSLWKLADRRAEVMCQKAGHVALRDAYRQAYMVIIDHGWLSNFSKPVIL